MNYQHIFHAGHCTDVFKHCVLVLILQKLCVKDSPFCVIETHAGRGIYDLTAIQAQRTGECETGIKRIYDITNVSTELLSYLQIVHDLNEQQRACDLKWYPGSPYIINHLLRPQDRLQLCELHPDEFSLLKQNFSHKKNIYCFHANGYKQLNALAPPHEKRGLVLIDPPYEQPDEFDQVLDCLEKVYKKFTTGIYAIWYPIKTRYSATRFYQHLAACNFKQVLITEFMMYPSNEPNRLNGSGMAIINSPWQLDLQLKKLLPELLQLMKYERTGNIKIEFLA